MSANAPAPRDRWEFIAARRLYSTLSQFEEIAVLAASRGDATSGQLDDEIVHRDLFRQLARDLGGIEPPAAETTALVNELQSLRGPVSLALLNLVAEQWLETVFHFLCAGWGAELFAEIEADESRHVADAWAFERASPEEIMQHLPQIEQALAGIAMSPGFALPIIHLCGVETLRAIGAAALKRHAQTCRELGVSPGPAMRRLAAVCRGYRPPPEVIPTTGRHLSLIRAATGPAPVWTEFEVKKKSTIDVVTQCLVAQVLHTSLRTVFRRETLYSLPARVMVRIEHPEGIGNVLVDSHGDTLKQLRSKRKRLRGRALTVLPRLGDTIELLPPAPASMAITALTNWGFSGGYVPLFEAEGIPIVVAIGSRYGATVIAITMDHRIYDAHHLALLRDCLQ